MSAIVTIDRLGAKGDGVADGANGPRFVPFALPGESVEIQPSDRQARMRNILKPSPERRDAPCPYFGTCGGCDLQHASEDLYRAFKRDLVVSAFAGRGLSPDIAELVPCPPASRRRAVFTAKQIGGDLVFGFLEAQSHRIIGIELCLVVVPEIAGRLADLTRLAGILADRKRPLRLSVTATASGLDIAASDGAQASEKLRAKAVAFALEKDFARLTVDGEIWIEPRKPVIELSGVAVAPPPGAFLQAVAESEKAMTALVADHLKGCKAVADLFCGMGTFTFALARASTVRAFESDAPALEALDRAARLIQGLKPVATERRDLFRRPLQARDLSKFDGVVFDPPRAGAEAQARELAGSTVKKIAAVSCNPATLARDARILVDGGYRLLSVTPIDQFHWSHHVEAVALFER